MSRWLAIGLFLLVVLLVLAGILYTWGVPRLVEVSPLPGATDIPAGTPLRLVFSRPMQGSTVTERLHTKPSLIGQFSWQGNTLIFTPAQPWPNGSVISIQFSSGARAAGWLALPVRQGGEWTFTTRHPLLAYLYPSDAPADLYAIEPDTKTIEQVIDTGEVLDFSLNPTGSIIYYSLRQGNGDSSIHSLDRQLGETRPILKCTQALCRYPHISPQGDYLAYERTPLAQGMQASKPQVWLLPMMDGSTSKAPSTPQVEPFLAGNPDHQTQQPAWSPTGLLTYYNFSLSAFILYDPHKGETIKIPSQTGQGGDWDVQGNFFIFPEILSSLNQASLGGTLMQIPFSHLLRYDLTDGSLRDLTIMDNLEDTSPVFSPDGKTIAFARKYLNVADWTPGRQIWLMKADGSDARPITNEPTYNHYEFAWSLSGDALAYVRFNQTVLTEPPEIWLVNAAGSAARRLIAGGYAPQWIP